MIIVKWIESSKEDGATLPNLVKAIKKSGANVLLVQKSILRDAVSDLALHYLNKLKILVVKGMTIYDFDLYGFV